MKYLVIANYQIAHEFEAADADIAMQQMTDWIYELSADEFREEADRLDYDYEEQPDKEEPK